MPKGKVLGYRLEESDWAELEKFCDVTGVEAVTLGRLSLRAALDYFNKTNRISFPLVFMEESDLNAQKAEIVKLKREIADLKK